MIGSLRWRLERLLCFFGFHDWGPKFSATDFRVSPNPFNYKTCKRSGCRATRKLK